MEFKKEGYLLGVHNGIKECEPEFELARQEGREEVIEKIEKFLLSGGGIAIDSKSWKELKSSLQKGEKKI